SGLPAITQLRRYHGAASSAAQANMIVQRFQLHLARIGASITRKSKGADSSTVYLIAKNRPSAMPIRQGPSASRSFIGAQPMAAARKNAAANRSSFTSKL